MVINEVAKLLGVTLFEEFKIKGYEDDDLFKITEDGLEEYDGSLKTWVQSDETDVLLVDLLTGGASIIIEPFEPSSGKTYFYPNNLWNGVDKKTWCDTPIDFALKNAGMVFKTREQCQYKLTELKEKYLNENKTNTKN